MEINEIRKVLDKMDVATSRGRAEVNGREILLTPNKGQIECDTKSRVDLYISIHREIAEHLPHMRAGMTEEELERVEFLREQLFDLAKDVSVQMVTNAMEARR